MSTQPSAPKSPQPAAQPMTIKVISHTNIIYWWPVWLVGFILAGLTYADGTRLAVLPAETTVKEIQANKVYELTLTKPPSESLVKAAADSEKGEEAFPVRIARIKDYGMVYIVVFLLVVFGSNVPLRGLTSIIAILSVFLLTLAFAYLGWWTRILDYVGGWHVEITLAGYLITSVVLLVLWLATVFLYDPMRYLTFTPGQFVVHKDIGDQRQVFDTAQIEVEKRRTDLFRYWVLGFGAGDMVVKVPSQALEIEFPNVMFVAQKVKQVANLMKMKPVLNE